MNDYHTIARVIRFLDEHQTEQPPLADLAAEAGLSPFHFHRLFSRWAGVTPKEFLQCLTLAHAQELLRDGSSVLNAALEAGLSGPGRLHDLCVNLEAASPGEIKSGGAGWTIEAGFAESPFGLCLAAESPRGICHLSFVDSRDAEAAASIIHATWPHAQLAWNDQHISELVETLMNRPAESAPGPTSLRAIVRGSEFQVRVWRALLRIPPGRLASYGRIAAAIGNGGAARAVGTAINRNPLAILIPCHRVIRETGVLGEYRWGTVRKKAIVAWESAARAPV